MKTTKNYEVNYCKSVRPHQYSSSSSHELPVEPRAKVVSGSGKHSVFSHFPKSTNCNLCLRINCRRRTGTVVPKSTTFWWFDNRGSQNSHKILKRERESRNNHRYAVVEQDLATQWLQFYPCKTQTSQETQKGQQKVLGPDNET